MTDILIRPCRPADLPEVRDLVLSNWLEAYTPFVPEADLRGYFAVAYAEENLRRFLDDPDNWITLAVDRDQPVGFLRTFVTPERRFHVASLYVAPGSQHSGIGRQLMARAEQQARELGHREIWIGVMTQNQIALSWYRRLGFVFNQEEPFTMGATSVPHLIGCRAIPP